MTPQIVSAEGRVHEHASHAKLLVLPKDKGYEGRGTCQNQATLTDVFKKNPLVGRRRLLLAIYGRRNHRLRLSQLRFRRCPPKTAPDVLTAHFYFLFLI